MDILIRIEYGNGTQGARPAAAVPTPKKCKAVSMAGHETPLSAKEQPMKYNFDEVIDRSANRSAKYDERIKKFGTDDVLPLWVADMDFRTAKPIIDACKAKAEEGIWGYTSRPDSYFEAVQQWQVKRNGWKPDISLMSWSLGVVPALSAIVKLFCKNGKVLIQTPVYSEFYDVVEAWGYTVVENQLVESDGHWHIDFDDFAVKARECDVFLLCNPHNPLGIVWTSEELKKMAEICMENNRGGQLPGHPVLPRRPSVLPAHP